MILIKTYGKLIDRFQHFNFFRSNGNLFDRLNSFTSKLKDKNSEKNVQWMKHSLKFHIDSEAAYKLDEKKRLLHEDQGDLEDGGLKFEVERTEPLMK